MPGDSRILIETAGGIDQLDELPEAVTNQERTSSSRHVTLAIQLEAKRLQDHLSGGRRNSAGDGARVIGEWRWEMVVVVGGVRNWRWNDKVVRLRYY